jgi:putative DNA primase/helicase
MILKYQNSNTISSLKMMASGRWGSILNCCAPQLNPTIQRGSRHGPCDLCGGKDRASCFNDFHETGGIHCNQNNCRGGSDGFAVLMWANRWTFSEALKAVQEHLNVNTDIPCSAPKTKAKDWSGELKKLENIWDESETNSKHLKKYLDFRGLSLEVPPTLRFSSQQYHFSTGKNHPAMIALVKKGDAIVGIHKTYLDCEGGGKAKIEKSKLLKKCAESMSGGAVRLFEPEPHKPLVVCEGIETALAIREYSGWPVWSCTSRTMLEKVELPEQCNEIIIGADHDRSGDGEQSAKVLASRLASEGRSVSISLPPFNEASYGDWLDFLNLEVACV